MFDSSTCFGPTGLSSGASINCVLLLWYVKIVSETCRAAKHIVNKYSTITNCVSCWTTYIISQDDTRFLEYQIAFTLNER